MVQAACTLQSGAVSVTIRGRVSDDDGANDRSRL
jgi:hypothetical protein